MSQPNTEIVVEIPIQKKIKIRPPKKTNKKNIVVEAKEEEEVIERCKGCGEVDGDKQYDWYCEDCYAEKLGHHQQPTATEEDIDGDDTDTDSIDEKIKLTEEQLKDLRKEKHRKTARENIVEIRDARIDECMSEVERIQKLIEKLTADSLDYQREINIIRGGGQDECLIIQYVMNAEADELLKKHKKEKKEKQEKKEPTYEGKGKKAGTGDGRLKDLENLNAGKTTNKLTYSKVVGEATWSLLYEGRKDGGLAVYKKGDEYFIPVFKDVAELVGSNIKVKKDYLEWIKN